MEKSEFRFKSPEIEEVQFIINQNFEEEKYNGITVEGKTQIKKAESDPIAQVKLRVKIGSQTEKFPFYMNVLVAGMFSWNEEMDEKHVDELLRINAPSLLISYVRMVAANITAFSKYSTFNLPFIDMGKNEAEYISEENILQDD